MNSLAFFGGGAPGLPEILIILFVVLLLFGAKKLPELSRSLGRSLSEFKKGREEGIRLESGEDENKDQIAESSEAESSVKDSEKGNDEKQKA